MWCAWVDSTHLGLTSIFCFGMAAAAPEFCCSTMRIIRRRAPDSWLEMIAGLSFNREVTFTSYTSCRTINLRKITVNVEEK